MNKDELLKKIEEKKNEVDKATTIEELKVLLDELYTLTIDCAKVCADEFKEVEKDLKRREKTNGK